MRVRVTLTRTRTRTRARTDLDVELHVLGLLLADHDGVVQVEVHDDEDLLLRRLVEG